MKGVILTAGEMRAAEATAIDAGTPVEILMERAGTAAAEAAWRFAGPLPTLVMCGPGNNGGDGYVVARILKERGVAVRVAALTEPRSAAATWAASRWDGSVEPLEQASPAPMLIDALFGTGLHRPLDEAVSHSLARLAQKAPVRIAIDLPSGVATDDGSILSPVPTFGLTVTFAALKPSHLLQPAARHMGRLAVADIGIGAQSMLGVICRPQFAAPNPDHHKYSRGYVALVAGEMPSAAALAASAALRAGAGYVRLIAAERVAGMVNAIVQSSSLDGASDARVGAVAIGPGLGRSQQAKERLRTMLEVNRPLVLDADALLLTDVVALSRLHHIPVLTPHAGEFAALFGEIGGNKVDQTRRAASRANAVVIFKGSDTVVAAPDGRAAIAQPAPAWLASAGTGDVLTGIVAAMRAGGHEPFEAACAATWMHGRAAELAGPGLIADDLVTKLPAVIAECS
jgi:hydroxyethylthiazole kinase-like uncharacterized protein yjeF